MPTGLEWIGPKTKICVKTISSFIGIFSSTITGAMIQGGSIIMPSPVVFLAAFLFGIGGMAAFWTALLSDPNQ